MAPSANVQRREELYDDMCTLGGTIKASPDAQRNKSKWLKDQEQLLTKLGQVARVALSNLEKSSYKVARNEFVKDLASDQAALYKLVLSVPSLQTRYMKFIAGSTKELKNFMEYLVPLAEER